MANAIQHVMRGLATRAIVRPVLVCNARGYAKKSGGMPDRFPDPIEHSTGLNQREMLAIQAGNPDPFQMNAMKRGPGTKEEPNLIPSMLDKRMIGCVCEEDSTCINYMWLYKGEQKRCECGYWFKLVDGKFL